MVVALLPFVFPLNQIFVGIDSFFNAFPIEVDLILDYPIYFLAIAETYIAAPFEPLLNYFGWWSNNAPIAFPDGPLWPGSLVVAATYAVIVYLLWSLVSFTLLRRTPLA